MTKDTMKPFTIAGRLCLRGLGQKLRSRAVLEVSELLGDSVFHGVIYLFVLK